MNDLMRYTNDDRGSAVSRRDNRAVARRVAEIRTEVQIKGLEVDGTIALGAHIMDGLVELDQHRQALAQGDTVTNMMLSEIESNTIRACKRLQNSLFNDWNL